MSSESLEHRVQRLQDRREIADLGIRYFLNADDFDAKGVAGLFTSDGCLRHEDGTLEVRGRSDLLAFFLTHDDVLGDLNEFPLIHASRGHLVTLIDDNTATGVLSASAERGQPNGTVVSAYRYYDTYRREEGLWRFQERLIRFWYRMRLSDLAEKWSDGRQSMRLPEGEPPTSADLPFVIESWRRSQWGIKSMQAVSGRR